MTFLFDSSSLILLIRSPHEERKVRTLMETKILDLTYYEIGNTVWKESELLKLLTEDELDKVVNAILKSLASVESIKLSTSDFVGILEIARRERLTFYDSSYLYVAKDNNMTLVSEDGKLSRIAKKYTKTQTVHSLL